MNVKQEIIKFIHYKMKLQDKMKPLQKQPEKEKDQKNKIQKQQNNYKQKKIKLII